MKGSSEVSPFVMCMPFGAIVQWWPKYPDVAAGLTSAIVLLLLVLMCELREGKEAGPKDPVLMCVLLCEVASSVDFSSSAM
jgi:hypothetical protein